MDSFRTLSLTGQKRGLGSKLLAQPFLLLAQLRVLHIGVCSISFSILIFSRMLYYVRMLLVIRIR